MMNDVTERIKEFLQDFIALLVAGKFIEIEQRTKAKRLTAEVIEQVIKEYRRTLSLPPENAYHFMDVLQIKDAVPPKWSVVMPLWTIEEGRSDLSLELTLTEVGDSFQVELDDLHVL